MMISGEQLSQIASLTNLRLEARHKVSVNYQIPGEEWTAKGLTIGQVQEVMRAYFDLRYQFPREQSDE